MTVLLWFLVGAGLGAALVVAARPLLESVALQRTNYRGATVPTAAGLVPILAALAVAAAVRIAVELAAQPPDRLVRTAIGSGAVLLVMTGFGLLGLLDDLVGVGQHGGFRGHLRALASGRLTTGGLKFVGGGLLSVVAVIGVRAPGGVAMVVVDASIVALAANTANLFDRAPGRALKMILALGAIVLVTLQANETDLGAVALGAAAACLIPDLRERFMLGDTGVNPLGAVVGLLVVTGAETGVRVAVLVGLLGVNVAAERVSFSTFIRRNALLHRLDTLGAPHRRGDGGSDTPPGALP